jgi:hypothetical protein
MKYTLTLSLFLLTSVLYLQAQNSPLVFEPATWDFGTVVQRKILNKEFMIQNTSDRAVRMLQYMPTHPNLSARMEKTVLEPGESTKVYVHMNTEIAPGDFKGAMKISLVGTKEIAELPVTGKIIQAPVLQTGTLKVDTTGKQILKIGK